MRFGTRFTLKPIEGQEREVTKYLWIPKQFGTGQWRWLEWSIVKEKVLSIECGWGKYRYAWVEICFVNT